MVDDDDDLRTVLRSVFERAGFVVHTAADGHQALQTLFEHSCSLVILDLGLTDMDGLEVLRRVRDFTDVPVLLLTARSRENDKVDGLMAGADDYLTKPFSNRELVARSLTLLRRSTQRPALVDHLEDTRIRLDVRTREVRVDGRLVSLSPTDWSLLAAFVRQPNQVLTSTELLDQVWHDPLGIGPERVKFAVLRLRKRLGWGDVATSPIQSLRGFGYRYRPGGDEASEELPADLVGP